MYAHVCVCVCACVYMCTNPNMVTESTVLATAPMVLHACNDQCECEFRAATDAVTPFTLCIPIHEELAHLSSLFICC